MCTFGTPKVPAQKIAAVDNREAIQQDDIEARLRRKRAGAAANIWPMITTSCPYVMASSIFAFAVASVVAFDSSTPIGICTVPETDV